MGEWYVSNGGSDTTTAYSGNGSMECPLRTIGRAVALADADGQNAVIHLLPGKYAGDVVRAAPGQSLTLSGSSTASVTTGILDIWGLGGTSVTISGLTVDSASNIHVNATDTKVTITDVIVGPNISIGPAIWVEGSGNEATVGPGVRVLTTGVRGNENVHVIGTTAAPTVISSDATCISGATTVSGEVQLVGCGMYAIDGAAAVSGVEVTGGGDGTTPAITTSGTISDTTVSGWQGDAIACAGCTISGGVQVSGTLLGSAVRVSGTSSISGLTATGNHGDAVRCDNGATLKLRGSTLNGNEGSGLLALGSCALDLGTSTEAGKNLFNRTSAPNGRSGLCLLQSAAITVQLFGEQLSCGYTGASCGAGSPSMAMGATCQKADLTLGPGITISQSGTSCCN